MRIANLRTLLATLLLATLVAVAAAQGGDFDVATGKQVTVNRAPGEGYPDPDGLKLTDGSFQFAWGDMVGWEGPDTISLVVDLGAIHESISYVALKLMRSDGSAVALPASAIVSVSEDGVLYEDLGMALDYLEGDVPNDSIGTLVWADEEWAGYGQFVKVDVRPGGEAWTMIAELQVGDGAVPADRVPAAAEGTAVTAEPVTVSLGKSYTLTPEAALAYPDEGGVKVTDGLYAYSWADMIGIGDPASNPVVVIDLGERVEGITRVAGLFMRSFASAVNLPYSLIVSVSDDGETFTDVGLAVRTVPEPIVNEYINSYYWQDLENPVAARYVKVEIRARTAWTMLAEVMVQTGAAVPEVEEPAE
ncbi:MAG TPA: discoidin domain-containing protein [Trueperaceae bacterium]|nr:discoidin domain-containing protein [Trueperaceae bacterium]